MSDKVSQGALELAHKWNGDPQGDGYRYRLAYLIDQELRELLRLTALALKGCSRKESERLSALLAKWTVRG